MDRLSDAVRLDLGHKGVKAAQQGEGAQPHQVGVVGDEAQRVHHVNHDGRRFRAFLLGWIVDLEKIAREYSILIKLIILYICNNYAN